MWKLKFSFLSPFVLDNNDSCQSGLVLEDKCTVPIALYACENECSGVILESQRGKGKALLD